MTKGKDQEQTATEDTDDSDRCRHGMFYSGVGACPQCGGGADLSDGDDDYDR